MASYVISDIHGEYDLFCELLEIIQLKDTDTLYVLGDVVDRGPHHERTLLKLMEMPNAVPIIGNHELMALECLDFLFTEITDESIASLDPLVLDNVFQWDRNGSATTIREFSLLDDEMKEEVLDYLREFRVYETVEAGGRKYLLVHAGLGNYSPDKALEDYSLKEIVWDRPDYGVAYYDDICTVSGHTPTQLIEGNPDPGYVYRRNRHIVIDCGGFIPGGRLAALCLDTDEVFYSSTKK